MKKNAFDDQSPKTGHVLLVKECFETFHGINLPQPGVVAGLGMLPHSKAPTLSNILIRNHLAIPKCCIKSPTREYVLCEVQYITKLTL